MNATVVGRGLVRSARLDSQGQYPEAGLQTLAAVATPAIMVQTVTAELMLDVIDAAHELSGKPSHHLSFFKSILNVVKI